jgi:tRNA(Ile)-lysidine synthase
MPTKITTSAFTRRIDRDVLDDARERGVLLRGERLVAGVSGGADSTALLVVLSRIAPELGLEISAAHFDHRLRSKEEAEGDRRFVSELCAELGVTLVSGQGDVRGRMKRNGESMEEAARNMRYRFLGATAVEAGASAVAVGHTLDDQAETVLLHLLRGSGLGGLAAMSPRSAWPFGAGPDVARPLIGLRRADTERYCRESGVKPRRDPTNDLPVATRNRLRNEVMPLLREFNPRIEEALSRLAEAAALDDEFVWRVADRDWAALASATRERVVFPREAFESFHPAIQSRLLIRAAAKVDGDAQLTADHIAEVRAALGRSASRVSLPGGLTCSVTRDRVTVTRAAAAKTAASPREVRLAVPGSVTWGAWTLTAEKRNGPLPRRIGKDEAYFDAARVKGRLRVRAREAGDRMRPLGMRGEKKLQDILVDAKVPEEERDLVPVVCDDDGIAWVAGQRLAERVAVRGAGEMIRLRARRKGGRSFR